MRPFAQAEKGKTKTALVVQGDPNSPMFSASIQKTPNRKKINYAVNSANAIGG